MNYPETTRVSTNVPYTLNEQETAPLTFPINLDEYVQLRIGYCHFKVSPTLRDGYFAACKAYKEMEEQNERGPYLLLTGYEYAHLTRKYIPIALSLGDKREWQRGFITGWTACSYGF